MKDLKITEELKNRFVFEYIDDDYISVDYKKYSKYSTFIQSYILKMTYMDSVEEYNEYIHLYNNIYEDKYNKTLERHIIEDGFYLNCLNLKNELNGKGLKLMLYKENSISYGFRAKYNGSYVLFYCEMIYEDNNISCKCTLIEY